MFSGDGGVRQVLNGDGGVRQVFSGDVDGSDEMTVMLL
jgi:hypothetical protein